MSGHAPAARILVAAAIAEGVTGLALVLAPGLVVRLLLGTDLSPAAVPAARVAGIAIAALALACWPGPPRAGMLAYGAAVALYLAGLGVTGTATGPLLWPAVAAHVALTCLLAWRHG